MLRPELQNLVAAGATCQISGRVDTYQREPHLGTVRVCLARCTVRPVHHLQDIDATTTGAITTDHLWVRMPAECIDGRPQDPTLHSAIARDASGRPPTRLLANITLVGRLGYYTDSRGHLGMGVPLVLPVYYGYTLVAMLAEAATHWREYNDAQAHAEALALLQLVGNLLRPLAPGQTALDTPRGPRMVLLGDGITADMVRSRAQRLHANIGASYAAQRRAVEGHRRARAKARAQGTNPLVPAVLPAAPVVAAPPSAVELLRGRAAFGGYVQAQGQQHQAVPATVAQPRAAGRRGFAA